MNFIHSIKFKFTLWYLAILGILLVLLAGGVYSMLSHILYRSLDDTLQNRARQLVNFRNIMSIVAGRTFEEEIGELISFYFYSDGALNHLSHKGAQIPVDAIFVDHVLSGHNAFLTIRTAHDEKLRVYGQQYFPDSPEIDLRSPPPPPPKPNGRGERSHRPPEARQRRGGPGERQPADRRDRHYEYGRHPEPPKRPLPAFTHPNAAGARKKVRKAALIVARPTRDTEMALEGLLKILLAAVPLTIFLAGGGGLFLSRRAFKPVDKITNTAREIEETDLSRRIHVHTKDELGRLAATLNQMIERLEKAFERQKEFTGDASHELRAPLAVIQAEATLALQKNRDLRSYQKSLEIISQETNHMSGIINQLLTLARADAGKERLSFEKLDLSVFIKELCADTTVLCLEKKLELNLGPMPPLSIKGDKKSLRRLMQNLFTNAIRYTNAGGRITVGLHRQDNEAVISVTDTGIGIPADALPFLFERFYRVDKARSRTQGGSGLGLAICRHIVNVHGGRISVESKYQKGSTFHVNLPLSLGIRRF